MKPCLVKPCLQHDGTSWRYGPKRISDNSVMKHIKIMYMAPPIRDKLLKKNRVKLARLRKKYQELEEECRMLSEHKRV